mgnify:CR=1 FL=1
MHYVPLAQIAGRGPGCYGVRRAGRLGYLDIASGATAVMVLALSEKERLRRWVARIDEGELRAGLQFAVLALVVLPLLPEGRYGPLGGLEPRGLWIIVLLFSALNFAGYVARRVVGPERGRKSRQQGDADGDADQAERQLIEPVGDVQPRPRAVLAQRGQGLGDEDVDLGGAGRDRPGDGQRDKTLHLRAELRRARR